MLKQIITRILLGLGLMCGSLAWTGWAYLHSAADPHRVEVVSTAVLSDPAARREIAVPLADQIIREAGIDPANAPAVRDAVTATMTDPNITTNIIAAFGSAQSKAFGVPDPRPTNIDGVALVTAVRDKLATVNPDLAAHIPIDAIGNIHLPELQVPFTVTLRKVAQNATNWLAFFAIALIGLCLLLGDRRHVLRRYGIWAILAGATWVIGPRLVVFLAHRWARSADATISVAVHAATKPLTAAATLLMLTGIGALVLRQLALLGGALSEDEMPPPANLVHRRRGITRLIDNGGPRLQPTSALPMQDMTSMQDITSDLARHPSVDRFPWADDNEAAPLQVSLADLDPWAHFSGPAPPAGVAIPNTFVVNSSMYEPGADSGS